MTLSIEQRIIFAVSPDGTGDGVPVILTGIPSGAWEYMRDGKTHSFDLTKVGVRAKLILFGAADHDEAMRAINASMAATNTPYVDRRRDDFSIEPKPRS